MNKNEQDYRFIKEVIKKKNVHTKDILIRLGCIIGSAVLFGMIAAVVFVHFLPVLQKESEETVSSAVEFEEDYPVAEVPEEKPEEELPPKEPQPEESSVEEEQEEEEFSYSDLYKEMQTIAIGALESMVTVTGITSDEDWFEVNTDSGKQASGVIVASNDRELYIVTEYKAVDTVSKVVVNFVDGSIADGRYLMHDPNTGLVVLRVLCADLSTKTLETVQIAQLGNSYEVGQGEAVIAIGSPMGYSNSIVYGQITSTTNSISTYDRQYNLFTTNMMGSREGSGVLLNLNGEVVGVIAQNFCGEDYENVIVGLPISQLKSLVEVLSNGGTLPLIGIKGQNVTEEVMMQTGMPKGVYVSEIMSGSPVFNAGIRNGDIIIMYNEDAVENMYQFTDFLNETEVGSEITLTIMRKGADGYREMKYEVEVAAW